MMSCIKVGINRPNFLPWLGFMALLDYVDIFIIQDGISISKGNFVSRNKIKTKKGEGIWISESKVKTSDQTPVNDVLLVNDIKWRKKIVNRIKDSYSNTAYFEKYSPKLIEALELKEDSLLKYNVSILELLIDMLGIDTEIYFATDLLSKNYDDAEERVIDLCLKVGGTEYYNAKDGVEKGLYEAQRFQTSGLRLYKQIYEHPRYEQINGRFLPYMSVIDLLFNCGDQSLDILRSGCKWELQK